MMPVSRKPPKLFTVESANACLPLVRAIAADMVSLARELEERRNRLESLTKGRNAASGDPYAEELDHVRQELMRDSQRLREYEQELADLGAIVQSSTEGLIDFPAVMDGRLVFLCWRFNEPEVLFWHERDAGFAGRQHLTADSLAGHSDGLA